MKSLLLANIREIFSYNKWADERLIKNIEMVKPEDYFKDLPIAFKNLHGLLSHLFYYNVKYYKKIFDEGVTIKADEELSKDTLVKNLLECSEKWNERITDFIDNNHHHDHFEKTLSNIFDLFSHSNYHRGQINIIISLLGYKPESLDIFLYRSQHVQDKI